MSRYEDSQSTSMYWFNRSNDLRGSAGAVWYALRNDDNCIHDFLNLEKGYNFTAATGSVFRMLFGLSLELLYKAVAVETGNEPLKTHDLYKLASSTNVLIDTEEIPILEILSHYITWAGRYPIPVGKDAESKFDEVNELQWEHLWDKVKDTKMNIKHPNQKLNWEHFEKLWSTGAKAYWKLRS
jgi:hypothetical protein